MTVAELIEALKRMPPKAQVVTTTDWCDGTSEMQVEYLEDMELPTVLIQELS